MVHFEHAETTLAAMMRPHRLPCLLTQALITILKFHMLALKGRSHAFGDATRVSESRANMTDVCHEAAAIEGEAVEEAFER